MWFRGIKGDDRALLHDAHLVVHSTRVPPPPATALFGALFEKVQDAVDCAADKPQVDLPQARPELCRDLCAQDPKCKAFTYVSPGIQGPNARCWLKDMSSRPERVNGLVSGVKH